MSRAYKKNTQTDKNLAWFLPRPKKDRYKGGMPLYAEEWLFDVARDILGKEELDILQLFCGRNKYGTRVDIKDEVNPDLIGDAHKLSTFLPQHTYDVVFADPPYSTEEARDIYGTPKLNYMAWTREADKYLESGGLLVVYHKYIMPNPNPEKYVVAKRVFIGNRTYHLPRAVIFFQKK